MMDRLGQTVVAWAERIALLIPECRLLVPSTEFCKDAILEPSFRPASRSRVSLISEINPEMLTLRIGYPTTFN